MFRNDRRGVKWLVQISARVGIRRYVLLVEHEESNNAEFPGDAEKQERKESNIAKFYAGDAEMQHARMQW
jgi:hypothetical protein